MHIDYVQYHGVLHQHTEHEQEAANHVAVNGLDVGHLKQEVRMVEGWERIGGGKERRTESYPTGGGDGVHDHFCFISFSTAAKK